MKIRRIAACLALFESLVLMESSPARAAEAPLPFPDPKRSELVLPLSLWDEVRAAVESADQPIGYSAAQLSQFGRDALLLESVRQRFADVRLLPRFSGSNSDFLLEQAAKLAGFGYGWEEGGLGEIARQCYLLQDVSSAARTTPLEEAVPKPPGDDWQDLPPVVKNLAGRLYAGAEAAVPWLRAAFDPAITTRACGRAELDEVHAGDLLALSTAMWEDTQLDQPACLRRETWDLLERTDRAYLAYGTVLLLRHVERALKEFAATGGSEALAGLSIETRSIATPLGDMIIGGNGDDEHSSPAFLVLETGGKDRYLAAYGAPAGLASPVGIVVDLGGNDSYLDPVLADTTLASLPCFGAAAGGAGLLLDLGGDDEYRTRAAGLGCGRFGSGILVDYAGNDRYFTQESWGQGAGLAGIGVLVDLAGDDEYSCARESQGIGETLGTGLLLDLSGNDRYLARDDGNISALYEGQSVAMSQGCGFGRRADLGDGHSLAGSFGLLIDGAGDDDYHAQVWSQGCGYWWGVGILEDRGGNDHYRNGKYSSGAAAHFAVGIHVDLSGDDRYNEGNETAKNQYQGHARDGAIGVFIDGDGNDEYRFRSHCAGSADLAAIGLFWDRRGDDVYRFDQELPDEDWAGTPPMGSTTRYPPFGNFRDDLASTGIFLDTGGRDEYAARGIGAEESTWTMNRYPRAWGYGVDRDLYEAP